MQAESASVTEQPTTRTSAAPVTVPGKTGDSLIFTSVAIADIEKGGGTNIRDLDPKELEGLAASIKQQGLLEPVLVTEGPDKKSWRLVAGFRRVAAAKVAGLKSVPVRILELTPESTAEVQLVENLQREDLSPIEEAKALKSLLAATGLTQEQVGKKIGKSQSYVANRIRLLALPQKGAELLASGKISPSAAEHLVKLPEGAAPEVERAFAELERKAEYRGAVTVQDAKWAADSAVQAYRRRTRIEKQVSEAKFPKCPVKSCGKNGSPPPEWSASKLFRCSAGHSWSPLTGKVEPKERSYSSGPSYRRPPAPTLPLVDKKVPFAVPFSQVANRILDAGKEVHSISIHWVRGSRARVGIEVEMPALKGARVGSLQIDSGWKFARLSSASEYSQRTDADRKRAAEEREHLVAWLGTIGKSKKGH